MAEAGAAPAAPEGATPGNFRAAVRAQPTLGGGDPALAMVQPAGQPQPGLVPDAGAEPPAAEPQAPADPTDPWEEQIHGLTARQVVEALKSGALPEELAKALKRKVKLPVGRDPQTGQFRHEEVELTIDQLERGNMRERDYTNGKRELAQLRRQAQEAIEAPQQLFRSWKEDQTGQTFERYVAELGLEPHLEQILQRRAQEYVEDQKLSPEARSLKAETKRLRAEAERYRREAEQARQQRPQQANTEVHSQVEQMAKNALAAVGVPYAPTSARYFGEALQAVWDQGLDLTPEMVATAAESARQQLMADRGTLAPAPATTAQPPAVLQGRPAPGPAGRPTQTNGQGGTVADFRKDMAALKTRR